MVRRRLAPLLIAFALLGLALPSTTHAAPSTKGLLISPIRQFLSVDAGKTIRGSFTVANLTDTALNVTVSVKQFSVADYTYDYTFTNPGNNWVQPELGSIVLRPNQSKDVPFSVAVPSGSTPGGHYYTLLASANLATQGVASTIQAADLLYLTVNGKLTDISHLQSSSISWFSFGHAIDFNLKPVNTGNIYSFVYVNSRLHGLFVKPPQTSTAHILMPGKVRELTGSIPAPLLPGIYKATYGYKTQSSNWIIQEDRWVVFIPPWFVAFVLAGLLFGGKLLRRRKRRSSTPTDTTPQG